MRATDPFWWDDAGAPQVPESQPLPPEADVVVIGAGLTGLAAARTLARAGRSVLVLDAGVPGAQASGRNGGMIGGGHRLSIKDMQARFGKDTAQRLMEEAHLECLAFCKDLMREEGIDCDYAETGRFRALWRDEEYDNEARALETLQQLVPVEAEMLPRARQHDAVASDLYRGGVLLARHGGLNPAKWVAGILNAAQRAGAQVQGRTPVAGVENTQAEFSVATPAGTVRAGKVLAATNGYTSAALPDLRRRIVPVPSFIVVTEPLGRDRMNTLIPGGRMIVESRDRHCYYRPSPDGRRLVFGGRAAMFSAPERLVQRQMRALITQIFPQLKDVRLTHSWRGRTGFSFNFLPNVGCTGGIWHALGYSGSGNAMAPYLGHKAALQILGEPGGETAFSQTGLPARWWHRGSPWFLPFADLTFRARDIANNLGRGT